MKNSSQNGQQDAEVPGDQTYVEYIPEITYYDTPPSKIHIPPPFPDLAASQTPGVPVVRAEEAFIVIFVLVLWVAAIALFINRWGKIRMLEPYQPKFHQEHRPSCPMIDNIGHASQHRTSFSKFNACHDPPIFANIAPTYRSLLRPRQNSVFVGSSNNMLAIHMNPPRKTKSAVDIQSLVQNETRPSLTSKSMLPMTLSVDRRPSSTPLCKDRRPSCSTGFLSPRPADRRPSASSEFIKDRLACNDYLSPLPGIGRRTSSTGEYFALSMANKEHRRPSFNNVIAQVTSERRPSSSMLRISNV